MSNREEKIRKIEEKGIPVGIFNISGKPYPPDIAKDAGDFWEKYGKKRYTVRNAGKGYLIDFLFGAYQMNSAKTDKPRFVDIIGLRNRITKDEDKLSYDGYYYLTEWLRSLYENAITVRNDLRLQVSNFHNIATALISAENIRNNVQGEQSTAFILWLNTLTLEAYQPTEPGGILLNSLRENIGQGIRYLKAYNTFLEEIADFTGIPEVVFLKVRLEDTIRRLAALNMVFKDIREIVAEHREPEIREAAEKAPPPHEEKGIKMAQTLPYLSNTLTSWTPEYLSATMRNFEPIGDEPPVPEERVEMLRKFLLWNFGKYFIDWYGLYHDFSMKYRKPHPAATPPDVGEDVEKTIEEATNG